MLLSGRIEIGGRRKNKALPLQGLRYPSDARRRLQNLRPNLETRVARG